MTEGRVAQSTVSVVLTPRLEPHSTEPIAPTSEIGVDILRYFNTGFNPDPKILDQLKDISKWAFEGTETVGDGLMKLKNLEMRLGVPSGNESRTDKIHRWIKIQRQIDDMRKRQEALR